jgi:hypothetical protein
MNAISGQDSLFEMASDLETVVGKLEALESLIGTLTEDTDLTMFSLMYSVGFIKDEAKGVSDRLYDTSAASRRSATDQS